MIEQNEQETAVSKYWSSGAKSVSRTTACDHYIHVVKQQL